LRSFASCLSLAQRRLILFFNWRCPSFQTLTCFSMQIDGRLLLPPENYKFVRWLERVRTFANRACAVRFARWLTSPAKEKFDSDNYLTRIKAHNNTNKQERSPSTCTRLKNVILPSNFCNQFGWVMLHIPHTHSCSKPNSPAWRLPQLLEFYLSNFLA